MSKYLNLLFYLLIFIQLELDLLLVAQNLDGLLIILLILLIYPKKPHWAKIVVTTGLWLVECFISNYLAPIFNLILILNSFVLSKILVKNLNLKWLILNLILVSYLICACYLQNAYLLKINFDLALLMPQIALNLAYANGLIFGLKGAKIT